MLFLFVTAKDGGEKTGLGTVSCGPPTTAGDLTPCQWSADRK